MKRVDGKGAFITGGASGIGLGMARAFGKAGVKLALADVDEGALQTAASSLRDLGVDVVAQTLDVSDPSAWEGALDRAEAAIGPISVLCNNAGIGGAGKSVAEWDIALWRMVMEVNLFGAFYGCRLMLPRMLERGEEAHIVNTASVNGWVAFPRGSAYSASKHAIVGLTDSLRGELADSNVGVSLLCPGMTNTNFAANSMRFMSGKAGAPPSPDRPVTDFLKTGASPEKVGERVLRAVLAGEYHILTHSDWKPMIEAHFAERLAAFGEDADPDHHEDFAALARANAIPRG